MLSSKFTFMSEMMHLIRSNIHTVCYRVMHRFIIWSIQILSCGKCLPILKQMKHTAINVSRINISNGDGLATNDGVILTIKIRTKRRAN